MKYIGQFIAVVMCAVFFCTGLQAQQTSILMQKANEAFSSEKWKSASTLYEMVLKDSANYSYSHTKAIYAGLKSGDSISLNRVQRLILNHEPSSRRLAQDIRNLCVSGKQFYMYEEFLNEYGRVFHMKQDSVCMEVLSYYIFLHMPRKVIAMTSSVMDDESPDIRMLDLRAKAFVQDSRSDEALNVYMKILSMHPFDFEANSYAGNYHFLKGNAALKELENEFPSEKRYDSEAMMRFHNRRREIIMMWYEPAIKYLNMAKSIRASVVIDRTLEIIAKKTDSR